ncbi:MAG: glycosyltransferase family 39 protein, partial [Bacteroidota bacterium]
MALGTLFSLDWPIFHDAPILHYIAWRINHGLVPYRDLFDMNMPGTYLLHLFCLRVFGDGNLAFRFFDISLLALSGSAIWALSKSYSRTFALVGALLFCSIHLNNGIMYAGQRDFMMLPFLLWAIFSIDRLHETGRLAHALVFSVCITAACWIKPIAVLLGIPCLIWFLISSHSVASKLRALSIMALSGLLVSIGIVLWLHWLGALEYFWRMLIDFLPLYSSIGRENILMWVARFVLALGYDLPMMIILFGLIWRYRESIGRQLPVLLIFVTYGYIHYYAQQKYWSYHAYPFWASLALAVAIVMPRLSHEISATAKLARACLLIFSLKSLV